MIWRPPKLRALWRIATVGGAPITSTIGLAVAIVAVAWTFWGVPTRCKIEAASVTSRAGQAFQVMLPHSFVLDLRGDTISASGRSTLRMLENEQPLGPPHSLHAMIEAQGRGMFSHWDGGLIFSSSDGTDPRYTAEPIHFQSTISCRPGSAFGHRDWDGCGVADAEGGVERRHSRPLDNLDRCGDGNMRRPSP